MEFNASNIQILQRSTHNLYVGNTEDYIIFLINQAAATKRVSQTYVDINPVIYGEPDRDGLRAWLEGLGFTVNWHSNYILQIGWYRE